jgi:uncharacterized protein with von Willebrand factor type A (vWA) domain
VRCDILAPQRARNNWGDNQRRNTERISTFDILHKYPQDCRVILVGDAAMRSGLMNLNSAISGNSGYKAGPKAV